ncbi:hypothetical protein RYX36_033363, partial [Vicia faba]
MLTAVANERNIYEIVTELCEDAANVDIPIARESIQAVGKIALQQYDLLLSCNPHKNHLLKTPISLPLQPPPSLSLASLRPNRSPAMTFGASTELSHYLAVPSVRPNSRYSQCTAGISFTLHNANGGFNGGLSKLNSNRNDNRAVSVKADGKGKGLTCKDAGVDIDAGSELVRRIAKMAPGIGGF